MHLVAEGGGLEDGREQLYGESVEWNVRVYGVLDFRYRVRRSAKQRQLLSWPSQYSCRSNTEDENILHRD